MIHAVLAATVASWSVVAGLAGAMTVAWALIRWAHGPARWFVVTLAAALTLATGADAANAYFLYLPHTADVIGVPTWNQIPEWREGRASPGALNRARSQGAVTTLDIQGRVSGFGQRSAYVYLPPQYFTQPHERFPVVYLLHGSPGRPLDWLRGGQAAVSARESALAGRPAVVVMPRVSRGWLDDPECVDGVHEKIETYVVRDLVPTVDAAFRTYADRAHRTVAGMSAGGYCALNLGLRNRGVFSVVIDMSGFTAPTHEGGLAPLFGKGPSARLRAAANTPSHYAPRLSRSPEMHLWLDVGRSDGTARKELRAIATVLAGRGLDVRYVERPGAHTFQVWVPAFRAALPWAVREMTAQL